MYNELLRLINAMRWSDMSNGGLERKERGLLLIRDLINKELRKVRAERKKLEESNISK